jgi:hypothetical protein
MNITFDPRNADDRSLVLALLGNLECPNYRGIPVNPQPLTTSDLLAGLPAEEKPKRTRRTKEQIAADEAKDKVDPAKAETEVLVKAEEKKVEEAINPPLVAAQAPASLQPGPDGLVDAGPVKTIGEHLAEAQAKPVPTKEELIAKFQALVAKFGKEKATDLARQIIQSLGAANVSGIPEAKRAEAVAKVDAELAKA